MTMVNALPTPREWTRPGNANKTPRCPPSTADASSVEAMANNYIRIADLTLEIEIFVRIMSRSSLLCQAKISMERSRLQRDGLSEMTWK